MDPRNGQSDWLTGRTRLHFFRPLSVIEVDSRASVLDREEVEMPRSAVTQKQRCPEDAQPKAFDHQLATPGINEIDSDRGKG